MSKIDDLEKLNQLRRDGAISEEEYRRLKEEAMNGPKVWTDTLSQAADGITENTWAMLLHFSQLLNFVVPLSGIVVPIVLWQYKKNESSKIDEHGKVVINWLLTAFIFGVVSAVLVILLVGYLGLGLLAVVGVIFPIIGGLEANKGNVWPYPFSIRFIK